MLASSLVAPDYIEVQPVRLIAFRAAPLQLHQNHQQKRCRGFASAKKQLLTTPTGNPPRIQLREVQLHVSLNTELRFTMVTPDDSAIHVCRLPARGPFAFEPLT